MPASTPELQRELRRIAVAGVSLLLIMAATLIPPVGWTFALAWLLAGLVCWSFVVWQCHYRLPRNCRPADNFPCAQLGLGNRITLLRGLLIAATAGFLAIPAAATGPSLRFLPALLYTLAALGDGLDGYLARRLQQTTQLGRELDTALDALGLLIAPLLAVLYGKLHASYLLVSMAYYLFQWGIHWRQQHGRPVYPLPPSSLRRFLAGLQMGLVATLLWPPLPAALTQPVGVVFMLPLLIGFIRDWLCVSGRLEVERESVP